MTHLLVHLIKEISILGPMFLHNRAQPEGSIAKGYRTEEVIEFCVDFIHDLDLIGVPESQHERTNWKGNTREAKLLLGGSVY